MIKKNYYKVPFDNIAFNELPFEVNSFKFLYAYHYNATLQNKREVSVCGVLDGFENLTVQVVKNNDLLLFREVLFFSPPLKGSGKWEKVGQIVVSEKDLILPKFRYSPIEDDVCKINEYSRGKWFILENGYYGILDAKKSNYSKVINLESVNTYAEDLLRLRVIVELIKRRYRITETGYVKYKIKFETLFKLVINSSFTKFRVPDKTLTELASLNIIPMLATKHSN